MYKFTKIERTDFADKPQTWMLCIDNKEALLAYLRMRGRTAAKTYLQAKEKTVSGRGHYTFEEWAIVTMLEGHPNRKTFVEDMFLVSDLYSKSLIEIFSRDGIALINPVGGILPGGLRFPVVATEEREAFVFPAVVDADDQMRYQIKVTKWFEGSHYYAKIGEMDVVMNGKVKWSTEDAARAAAKKFLAQLKTNNE